MSIQFDIKLGIAIMNEIIKKFTYNSYNKIVAEYLGWTNIIETFNADIFTATLLGTPPDGGPNSRGMGMVPDFVGNWNDCAKLFLLEQFYEDDDEDKVPCVMLCREIELPDCIINHEIFQQLSEDEKIAFNMRFNYVRRITEQIIATKQIN